MGMQILIMPFFSVLFFLIIFAKIKFKPMNSLKNAIKIFLWKFWMIRGILFCDRKQPGADKIRRAVRQTLYRKTAPEERLRIEKIEDIRKRFAADSTPVDVTDYGAGDPDSQRSEAEMAEGQTQTTTYSAISMGSKPPLWAHLLFQLVREFRPNCVLELGTCIGISAAYQATAQKLNGKGRLVTLEGSQAIASLAEKNLDSLRLDNAAVVCGKFSDSLPCVLKGHPAPDYVFIDGHHDEKATIGYYEQLLPALSPGAILIFDDISWSEGMKRAWKKISRDKNTVCSINLRMIGICLTRY
jgi:predicted O-methyltransferase YrrM